MQMYDFELLGRVLDEQAALKERKIVLAYLPNTVFEECLRVALRATILFNKKVEAYEKV